MLDITRAMQDEDSGREGADQKKVTAQSFPIVLYTNALKSRVSFMFNLCFVCLTESVILLQARFFVPISCCPCA